jgi:hypothetical protein
MLHVGFKEQYIEEMHSALWYIKTLVTPNNLQSFNLTEFLGLEIDYLNWKNHTEHMIPQLSGAHYAVRSMTVFKTLTLLNQFTMLAFILFCSVE